MLKLSDLTNIISLLKKSEKPKVISDTIFHFEYSIVEFKAGIKSIGKYGCYLDFIDTLNNVVYNWMKLKPGYTTWTEEGHSDFTGIELFYNSKTYFIPSSIFKYSWNWLPDELPVEPIPVLITAEVITRVNGNNIIPLLVVKNVKKI